MFWTFIVLGIVMWLLQGLLNIYQLKKFNKELKNLRQSGRVAIGKARGRFKAGCLLLLCIDDDCKIITGKKLQGVTSFARFKGSIINVGVRENSLASTFIFLQKKKHKYILFG